MIGLKQGSVILVPHQSDWSMKANQTIELIKHILAPVAIDVQHIGSTAIPHLHAKPILDIVVGVKRLDDVIPYLTAMQSGGFVYRAAHDADWERFFVVYEEDLICCHIHVVRYECEHWFEFLLFRNALLYSPMLASDYQALKCHLSKCYPNDRVQYTKGKEDFIASTIQHVISELPFEKSCGAVLFTEIDNQRMYLLIESMRGNFGFPKGHVENDETELQTAIREIHEEVGLIADIKDDFREEVQYLLDLGTRKVVVYFIAPFDAANVIPQPSEVKSYQVLPYRLAHRTLSHQQDKIVLEKAERWLNESDIVVSFDS